MSGRKLGLPVAGGGVPHQHTHVQPPEYQPDAFKREDFWQPAWNRAAAEKNLASQPPGITVCRRSSQPRHYCLSTQSGGGKVNHILVLAGEKAFQVDWQGQKHTFLTMDQVMGFLRLRKYTRPSQTQMTQHDQHQKQQQQQQQERGHQETVDLLTKTSNVDQSDSTENQYDDDLFRAAWNGDLETVRRRIEAGADVNGSNTANQTPLFNASAKGHKDVVKALLGAGADPEKARLDGWTPLHVASDYGHEEVIRALLRAGAGKEKKSKDGETALQIAREKGHEGVVDLLSKTSIVQSDSSNSDADRAVVDRARAAFQKKLEEEAHLRRVAEETAAQKEAELASREAKIREQERKAAKEREMAAKSAEIARKEAELKAREELILAKEARASNQSTTSAVSEEELIRQVNQIAENQIRRAMNKFASTQLSGVLERVQGMEHMQAAQFQELRSALTANAADAASLIQSALDSVEYSEQIRLTEVRLRSLVSQEMGSVRSNLGSVQSAMQAIVAKVGANSAKLDPIYTKHLKEESVLREKQALLALPLVSAFYQSSLRVFAARLQSSILLASGLFQGKQGAFVGAGESVGSKVEWAAEKGAEMLADTAEVVSECVPIVGKIVSFLIRKGCEKIDDHRTGKRLERAGQTSVTTQDAIRLAELSCRRLAQTFRPLIDENKSRFDGEDMEKAGRKAGEHMFAVIVGGKFDSWVDFALKRDETLADDELSAYALVFAVESHATDEVPVAANAPTGMMQKLKKKTKKVLKSKGGIFNIQLTREEVAQMTKQNARKESDAARKHREQEAADKARILAEQELLRKQIGVLGAGDAKAASSGPSDVFNGVKRGHCKECGADECERYVAPPSGAACENCDCKPVKHENLGKV